MKLNVRWELLFSVLSILNLFRMFGWDGLTHLGICTGLYLALLVFQRLSGPPQ